MTDWSDVIIISSHSSLNKQLDKDVKKCVQNRYFCGNRTKIATFISVNINTKA